MTNLCWICLLLVLLPAAVLAEPQMLARDWGEPVSLRGAVVVAPSEAAGRRLAGLLAQAGITAEALRPEDALAPNGLSWKPEVAARPVVVLGGIHTNRAMLPLYGAYLSLGDAAYPGGDGFVIRTIHRPFGTGHKVITLRGSAVALEASTPAGEEAAIRRFGELLAGVKDGLLPPTLEAHLSPERQKEAQAVSPALRYLLTGQEGAAREGAQALLAAMDPQTGLARYGDYGIERFVRECAALQDAPGVTPEEQLRLDQGLLRTLPAVANEYWRARDGKGIGGRHQTMGTSCFAATVQLLRRRGRPDPESARLIEQWWGECQAYWRNACTTFHDDLEGIPIFYSPEPTLDWALALGQDGYLREQLPLVALRACAVTDSLGCYAGTGTYEECRPGDVWKQVPRGWVYRAAEFFHPGRGFGWLQRNTPDAGLGTWGLARSIGGARAFATGAPEVGPPNDLLGIVPVPLGEYRYARLSHDRDAARAARQAYVTAPQERCSEKLCLRDRFDIQAQYLLLEGYQGANADNQPPRDANSIIRFTDLGHVWLHSNSEKAGNLFRSAVYCTDGVNDLPQPAGCELQASHNGARIGLATSHLPDYGACDWTRNLLWRKGGYFVVIDLVRQAQEGRFSLVCTFRTPQHAWLQPDGMLAREGDGEFRVASGDPVRLSLEGGREREGAAIPTLLREMQALDGGVGTLKAFRNLLVASDPAHPARLEIRPVGSTAALIRGTLHGEEELALVAAAPRGAGVKVAPFGTDGQVLYIGSAGWAQAGGTGITIAGSRLQGAEGPATPALRAALKKLWRASKPAVRPRTAAASGAPARRLWRYEGFTPLPERAPAPIVTSDPEPAHGRLAELLDGVVTQWPTVNWARPTITVDLREARPVAQIDFQSERLGGYNQVPDPATYPPPQTVKAEFSSDGFRQDVRRKTLQFTSGLTFEDLHKGTVFPMLRWTCRDIGETARALRLSFPGDKWGALALAELTVRVAGTDATRIAGRFLGDVDGDGRSDVLAWTDQAELAAVRADGTPLWKHRFPGAITAAACFAGLGPGGPRTLVTTREAHLYCLKADGTELWRTDFLESAKQNTDLPTGYSIGTMRRPDGSPLIVVGNYNLATFVSPEGKVLQFRRLPAAYQTMTLSHGFDFDGDGQEETLSSEVWGCLSVLGADLSVRKTIRLPRGAGVRLDYWQTPTAEKAKAIVCTENGCGLLNLKTLAYDWQHDVSPISDCVVADLNGDGRPELAVAKSDGYVLLYDESGKLIRSLLLGEPVRALAAVRAAKGGPVLVAALPGRLVRCDAATRASNLAAGEYHRLSVLPDGALVAFGDRVIDAYQVR